MSYKILNEMIARYGYENEKVIEYARALEKAGVPMPEDM